ESDYVPLKGDWAKLDLQNVNFSYDTSLVDYLPEDAIDLPKRRHGNTGLTEVSLSFRRGEKIAFIGHNGSGKTTLMSLLKGIYTPRKGFSLYVDGQPVADWRSLADTVTLFPQQPEIFESTVGYNLTLDLPFKEEDIEEACKIAGFDTILEQLPGGLDFKIHENGGNLSGGQKQRLALARGILASQSSSIVLLDEFTSNIDQQTETEIYTALFEAFKDKVIIWSVHQLNLLPLFDSICFLEKGKIVHQGDAGEVLQKMGEEQVSFLTEGLPERAKLSEPSGLKTV
ncbi:MAG: ATP-binding cassette domain-containing protein, partial [Bacteroidota bacterium]